MEYNVQKAIEAQRELCDKKSIPNFAPSDGICYFCGEQIYNSLEVDFDRTSWGITVEKAAKQHISGCPHCSRSYCD